MLEPRPYIRVKYIDDSYDYVAGLVLDKLIRANKIKQFYRYSEEKWVTPGVDPIRGMGGLYTGAERRRVS
ncbi:MAG TPA: hypothetical protein PLA74_02600 [Syntrophales bacterium]|nr:hypothetical protein [Syntrophales bacterium]HPQ43919.1 hypothetical protein [Syntrophales bacterium]